MIKASVFKNKNIAVVGLGKTGLSACKALSAGGAHVVAWDDFENGRDKLAKAALKNVSIVDPKEYDWSAIDALVLSAGIPLTHPMPHGVVPLAKEAGCPIICDVEILYRQCPDATYVGITGTNGKSTTTSLVGHIVKSAKIPCDVGGNLGTSATDFSARGEGEAYIIEMSSYQLDLIDQTHFNISVLLNITPDHLDRHGGMEGYIAAKSHIFDRQGEGDTAVIAIDDEHTREVYQQLVSKEKISNIAAVSGKKLPEKGIAVIDGELIVKGMEAEGYYPLGELKYLPGEHNAQNIAASVGVCLAMGIHIDDIIDGIQSFTGLAHRMQYVGEHDGLTFINDSKATNADAAAKALGTFSNIYWIAGGVAKDGGIESLAPYFDNVTRAYLIGEAREAFARTLDDHHVPYTKMGTMEEAFSAAVQDAKNNEGVVLLSPACASFDQYPNFEIRGEAFCALVEKIKAS
jgi:UDP-N-acetylmuramoylalanine--D-glutamate ligase